MVDQAAHDIFRCGVQVRSNDVGNGGIWVLPAAMRVLTSAQVLLGRASTHSETLYHTIHQGDMGRVAQGITGALVRAADDFGDFESTWRRLRQFRHPYGLGHSVTDEEALSYIQQVFLRKLDLGMPKEDVVAQLLACHRIEPVGTAADLVNAVGRLHASPQINQYQREKLEEATMQVIGFFAGKESS